MTDTERITQAIFTAVDEINQRLPPAKKIDKTSETVLFGKGGKLDSLELVNLIVTAEQKLEESFGLGVSLADERAMSQEKSPFRTIATLTEYVSVLLKEEQH